MAWLNLLLVCMLVLLAYPARAEAIELVCKGDSYVYVNQGWQKLNDMQVRLQVDLEQGQLVEYPLARDLSQFTLRKSDQFVNFTRKVLFAQARLINETLQINRRNGQVLHILVDPRSGQKQTLFAGKCGRGRMLF